MAEILELDPLFDTSLKARMHRFTKKLLESRYVLIAILIHVLALLIFGGKVIYEAYQRVNVVEEGSLVAPSVNTQPPPPPPSSPEQNFDVKVTAPTTTQLASKLAVDRLSSDFNVAAPDIQSVVSASMAGGGMGGGSGGGVPGGTGFAPVNFFGVKTQVNNVIFVVDISRSMCGGQKIGNDYRKVEQEVSRAIRGLTVSNSFNIVTFAKQGIPYQTSLLEASLINKDQSLRWFFKQNPDLFKDDKWKNDTFNNISQYHLGTVAHHGLEEAFKQHPAMIMFISDGEPTGIKPDELLQNIKKWQAEFGPGVVINAVFYKTGDSAKNQVAKKFMEDMAKQNGGQFKSIE